MNKAFEFDELGRIAIGFQYSEIAAVDSCQDSNPYAEVSEFKRADHVDPATAKVNDASAHSEK